MLTAESAMELRHMVFAGMEAGERAADEALYRYRELTDRAKKKALEASLLKVEYENAHNAGLEE